MRSEKRSQKISNVVRARQHSLHVVLENIHDPHNVSAIFRTCDVAGVPAVSLIYNYEKFPKIGKKSSASAYKWIEKDKFKSVEECYSELKEKGFQIIASSISSDSVDLYDIDFKKKTAIVLGNEHRGVSDEAANLADVKFPTGNFTSAKFAASSETPRCSLPRTIAVFFLKSISYKSTESEEIDEAII